MALKTLEDLETLEQRVMQIAGQETELLVSLVATPEAIAAAASDPEIMKRQASYKKNAANTYLLCERILRYIQMRKAMGRISLDGMDAIREQIEKAQERATRGVTAAKAKLMLVGGNGTRA